MEVFKVSEAVKRLFLRLVLRGLKTINDIPLEYRDEIQVILDEQQEA